MKLIITMAGRGSRFKQEGIDTPKHRLLVDGRTMFNYALSSLKSFFDEEFVFITQASNEDEDFVAEQCAELGIDDYEIVELSGVTDGQATTALEAGEFVAEDEEIGIYNIDTYIEEGTLDPDYIRGDGWIPTFSTLGDQWSFVELDDDGYVVSVAEKERISDQATVGFYHFGSWELFKRAYAAHGDAVAAAHGEKYICPLYTWLIEEGYSVRSTEIDEDSVHVLGTPEDMVKFYPEFAPEHGLE